MSPVASILFRRQYNTSCTSGLVGDVTFHVAGPRRHEYDRSDSPGGSTGGAKSDVYDCLVAFVFCHILNNDENEQSGVTACKAGGVGVVMARSCSAAT